MTEGKQREKMLDELTKWLKVGRVREALKAIRDIEMRGKSWSPTLKGTAHD